MRNERRNTLVFKISLLSISLFLTMAPQVSAALPLMYGAFPHMAKSAVETLVTIPNFGIMMGLLLSPLMIRSVGRKPTIVTGLLMGLLSGIAPLYVSSYAVILLTRFLLGVGIGLFNSLAVSLIPYFYLEDGDELATMVGFQNVVGSIGAAATSLLVSSLITVSWHAVFAIYLTFAPSLVLFAAFVPLGRDDRGQTESSDRPRGRQCINREVIEVALLMLLLYIFFMPMSFKLPALVVEGGLGTPSQVALMGSITTLIGIPVGMMYGICFKRFGSALFPTGFALVTLGFLAMAYAPSFVFLVPSIVLVGAGFGLSIPYIYTWLDRSAPKGSINLATTISLILVNIGCFVSPTVVGWVAALFGVTSPRGEMLISMAAFAVLFVYALIHHLRVRQSRKRSMDAEAMVVR